MIRQNVAKVCIKRSKGRRMGMKCGDVVVVAEKYLSCLDILHTHVESSY